VGRAEELFASIGDAQAEGLPKYQGDLLLREHSAGSLTSQAFMKELNRRNEILADAAERALVAASELGALPYPVERMRRAWGLVLRSQFHDVITGTSLPTVYDHAHNDEFLAMNTFVHSLEDAVGGIARGLDTEVPRSAKDGVPLVVYNPLSIERQDIVELELPRALVDRGPLSVLDPEGGVSPVQISKEPGGIARAVFLAKLPSLGFFVFTLVSREGQRSPSELAVSPQGLENARYRVRLDERGDVARIFDKSANRDVLASPMKLSLHTEWPSAFPAWNMDWADRKQPPREFVDAAPKIEILEAGPIRASVRIEREAAGSRFVQIFRLAAGTPGDRLEMAHRIDWKTPGSSLKATLPFTFGRREATYTWGLGTIERGNNDESQFEVPTHGFIDLTDRHADYGMTVLTGAKYGSDKPEDHVLRLTLLYTPVAAEEYREQGTQDFGRHEFSFALVSHSGALSKAWAEWQRLRFEYPPIAFRVGSHPGPLGRSHRLLSTNNPQIAVQALKRSEDGQHLVLRLRELEGKRGNVVVRFHSPVVRAWEMTGAEREIGPVPVDEGTLRLAFSPNQLRTIGLRLAERVSVPKPTSVTVELPFDVDAVSGNRNRGDGNLDGAGGSWPAEQLPGSIEQGGVRFILGSSADGQRNAVAARGQRLPIPVGYSRVHVLAAAAFDAPDARFTVGNESHVIHVPRWTGHIGRWDRRIFRGGVPELSFSVDGSLLRVEPAFLDPTRVTWWASHRHRAPSTDVAYSFAYLYSFAFELGENARELGLPEDPRILIFAVTVSRDGNDGAPVASEIWPDLRRDETFRARFAVQD
jgi:alpha-mannosidase